MIKKGRKNQVVHLSTNTVKLYTEMQQISLGNYTALCKRLIIWAEPGIWALEMAYIVGELELKNKRYDKFSNIVPSQLFWAL